MLQPPIKGFRRSINEHNIDLDAITDWIEASILLGEDRISTTDIIDILMEENWYQDQDFAYELLENVFFELKARLTCLRPGSGMRVFKSHIKRNGLWTDNPAYCFCMLLSLSDRYDINLDINPDNYIEQGELFELIAMESIRTQFSGWQLHRTGWSINNAVRLSDVIGLIIDKLGEKRGNLEDWSSPQANESGLDILLYRQFPDGRVGIPIFLLQCASGKNWRDKVKSPDIDDWKRYVQFAAPPQKAFAIPFSLTEAEFVRECGRTQGVLLDRYRILAADLINPDWISAELRDRINTWIAPRIPLFPQYE
jgi:hypothetical protein